MLPGAEAPFVSELKTLLASESQELEEGIQQELELLQADKGSRKVNVRIRAVTEHPGSPALTFKS